MRDVTITLMNEDIYTYCEGTYNRYTFNSGFFSLFLDEDLVAAFNTTCVKSIEFVDPEGVVIHD